MNGTVYFSGAPVACTSGERILRCAGFAQDSARPFARKAGTGAWPQCGHLPSIRVLRHLVGPGFHFRITSSFYIIFC